MSACSWIVFSRLAREAWVFVCWDASLVWHTFLLTASLHLSIFPSHIGATQPCYLCCRLFLLSRNVLLLVVASQLWVQSFSSTTRACEQPACYELGRYRASLAMRLIDVNQLSISLWQLLSTCMVGNQTCMVFKKVWHLHVHLWEARAMDDRHNRAWDVHAVILAVPELVVENLRRNQPHAWKTNGKINATGSGPLAACLTGMSQLIENASTWASNVYI